MKRKYTTGHFVTDGTVNGMPWTVHVLQPFEELGPSNGKVATAEDIDGDSWTRTDNAHLICEAFNTYTETGRTPAQLAAERAELVAALEGAEIILAKLDTIRHLDKSFGGLDQLRAILAKVKGPVQS